MNVVLALLLGPLLLGVVRRVKALFAGRRGAPLLQGYFDLAKLAKRGVVYSETTTVVFRAAPLFELAALLVAVSLVPLGGVPALFSFPGDFVAVAYLLALVRFATVLAALDTGSAFEGMGASREVTFSALAEPSFVLCFAVLAHVTGRDSLSAMLAGVTPTLWLSTGGALLLTALVLGAVFLAENARIPFDDPTTHLELTMVHEVMVLDHGGPDLALIELASSIEFWLLGSLLAGVLVPVRSGVLAVDAAAALMGLVGIAVAVGVVESTMARLRLSRVPQLLLGCALLVACALIVAAGNGPTP